LRKRGFQDATISEISRSAGVSDATVYEYFKSKEELLFAIPEGITEDSIRETEKVLPYLRGAESKLRAIVQSYVTTYEKNPEYANLIMLHLKTNRNFLRTKAFEVVRDAARMLLECIKEGIDTGTFRRDTDPYLVRSIILGTIEHLCTRKHLQGQPENMLSQVDPMVDLILSGIRHPRNSRTSPYICISQAAQRRRQPSPSSRGTKSMNTKAERSGSKPKACMRTREQYIEGCAQCAGTSTTVAGSSTGTTSFRCPRST
jgi:TetR/AcrR family fatty acid metabolism transcriptional regulator